MIGASHSSGDGESLLGCDATYIQLLTLQRQLLLPSSGSNLSKSYLSSKDGSRELQNVWNNLTINTASYSDDLHIYFIVCDNKLLYQLMMCCWSKQIGHIGNESLDQDRVIYVCSNFLYITTLPLGASGYWHVTNRRNYLEVICDDY